jgi:2Fe-2S ferredoxin
MRVIFIDASGGEHLAEGDAGESAMRCAIRNDVPGIIGECGGSMACATCHGYVVPPWAAMIPPATQQERGMVDGCLDVRGNSRLTCQIKLIGGLDGLTIEVPQAQT